MRPGSVSTRWQKSRRVFMDNPSKIKIGIIGGTGKEGLGLAYRWVKAGYRVMIGSRNAEKALNAANEVVRLTGNSELVSGVLNETAATQADILVLTVPFSAHVATCEMIKPFAAGKIVIDVTVPLVPPKVTRVQMPPEGSVAQQAQRIFGESAQVVDAFQNISYENLLADEAVECDVLVCGGNKEARQTVIQMIEAIGLVAWNAGPIENAVVVEGMTSVLIGLNKQYGVKASGIRITGIEK